MNNTMKKTAAGLAVIIMALSSFAGCSDNGGSQEYQKRNISSTETVEEVTKSEKSSKSEKSVKAASKGTSAAVINTSDIFSERDLSQTADTSEAKNITVSDGKTIDITDEGVYIISGSAKNCTLKINADENAKIQLVLDGAEIENDDFPAVYVVSADKVFITTTENGGSLAVNKEFTSDGETNTDAVIYSKEDIVLNGMGTLTVYSAYGNGISTKDDLRITGGTYRITSAKDAFEANDSISVCDGDFTVNTNKDAFHCENSDDDTLGQIYIAGGSFVINAKSDGIHGTTYVQIDGGTFSITSSEGIEASYVQINGGDITIDASDDGINASRKSSACDVVVEFNGGNTKITMGQGDTDGVDSNGKIIINGGTIDVTAQMSSFDYDSSAELNGGTVIVNGKEVDEIPQSMMGGPAGMGGHGGFGGFSGMPDGDFTPPEGFTDDDFTPPTGFDGESGATEKFGERGSFGGKADGNFNSDENSGDQSGSRRGGFRGGQGGGFGEKDKSETGGFIERT